MATLNNAGIRAYSKNLERDIPEGKAYINLCPFESNVILQINLISEMGLTYTYNHQRRNEKGTMGNGGHISLYKAVDGTRVINPDFSSDRYILGSFNEETGLKLTRTEMDRYGFSSETTLEDRLGNQYKYSNSILSYPCSITMKDGKSQKISVSSNRIVVSYEEKKAVLSLIGDGFVGSIDYYENNQLIKSVSISYVNLHKRVSNISYTYARGGEHEISLLENSSELVIQDETTHDGEKYVFQDERLNKVYSVINDTKKELLTLEYDENQNLTTISNTKNEKSYLVFDSIKYNARTCYYNSISYDDKGSISCSDFNQKLQKKYDNSFDVIMLNNAILKDNSLSFFGSSYNSSATLNEVEKALFKDTAQVISNPSLSKKYPVNANGSDTLLLTFLVKSVDSSAKITASLYGSGNKSSEVEVNVNNTVKMVCVSLDVINAFTDLNIEITGTGNFVIGRINLFRHSFANFYQYDESGNNLGNGTIEYKNNLVSGIVSENSVKYNLKYNDKNELTSFKAPYGVAVNLEYQNNEISKETISGNGYSFTTEMSYQNHKLVKEKTSLGTTEYEYDSFGALKTVKNALGHITENVYDKYGDVIGLILKESESSSEESSVTYEYDSKRNISKITIKNGTVYSFEYDETTNALLKIKLNGTCVFRYVYDASNEHIISQYFGESSDHFDFSYNDKDLITKVTYSGRELSYLYLYDDYDRLLEIKEVTTSGEKSLEIYSYNLDGVPYKTKLANSTIAKDFDNLGHTSRVRLTFPSETIVQEFDTIDRSKGSNPESLIQDFYKNNDYCITPFMEDCNAYSNNIGYPCYIIDENSSDRFKKADLNILYRDGNLPYFNASKKVCFALAEKAKFQLGCETISFWFKSSSHNNGCIFALGRVQGKNWLKVSERNGKIILEVKSQHLDTKTVLEIPSTEYELNKWNFFSVNYYTRHDEGCSFDGQALIHINSKTYEKHWTDSSIWTDLTSEQLVLTLGYELDYDNVTTSNFKSDMKFSFVAIARRKNLTDEVVMELYRKTRDYIFDNFYLSGEVRAVDYAVTARYKQNTSISYKMFPLENNLYSFDYDSANPTKACQPKTFDMRFGTSIDKDRTFNFNKKLDRYAYVADGNVLVYETDLKSSGTIAGMYYFAEDGENQYLFEAKSGRVVFGLCRRKDMLALDYNGHYYQTKIALATDKWYKIALSYDTVIQSDSSSYTASRYIRIICDDQEEFMQVSDSSDMSNRVSIMIGRSFDEIEVTRFEMESHTCYAMFGQIANLAFSPSYNIASTIRDVFAYMNDFLMTKYYDEMGLLVTERTKKNNVKMFEKNYIYNNNSLLLSREVFNCTGKSYARYYNYDSLGNLTKINDSYNGSSSYVYDYRGYLVSETNSNGVINYTYDSNGNILTRGNNTFKYDSNCPDKLISYNGNTVSYSSSNPGNITKLPNYDFGYEGRRLRSVTRKISSTSSTDNYVSATYTYNDKGLRTSKILEYYKIVEYAGITPILKTLDRGTTRVALSRPTLPKSRKEVTKKITYTYEYDGDKLILEKSDDHTVYYLYDENNELYGYILDGKNYYYMKDRFNNILGLIDDNGQIVVQYRLDAYGNVITKNDSIYNPIRYKGYYYDSELNFYYCQSRYYVPFLCRWLNMDNPNFLDAKSINGLNLFAYCNNNPVMGMDPTGHFALSSLAIMLIVGTVIGAATGFGFTAGKELIENDWKFSEVDWGKVVNNTIVGGALGFSLAMGVGYLGPVIAGTAAAGTMSAGTAFGISVGASFAAGSIGYATEEWMNGRTPSLGKALANGGFVAAEGAMNFLMGGIMGSVGNVGTKGKFLRSVEWYAKFAFLQEFTFPFKYGIDAIRRNM